MIIVGDKILSGISERGLTSKNRIMKLHPNLRATNKDLVDQIEPVVRRKPNMVVLHIGTKDLTNGINTQEKVQEVIDILRSESKARGGVHDLRMDGGLPPGFQKGTLF